MKDMCYNGKKRKVLIMSYSEEKFLYDLHALSLLLGGVEIKFFSADGISRFLNHQNKDMPFCAMMFASPYGYRECTRCDRKNLQYAQKTGECIQYRCHMMLTEIIQPVFLKERYVGSLFYGQFHEKEVPPQRKWDAIASRLKNWGIPEDLAKENYFRLPVLIGNRSPASGPCFKPLPSCAQTSSYLRSVRIPVFTR